MNLYKATLLKQKSFSNDTQDVYVIADNIGLAESKALEANKKIFNDYFHRVSKIDVIATENQYDTVGVIYF